MTRPGRLDRPSRTPRVLLLVLLAWAVGGAAFGQGEPAPAGGRRLTFAGEALASAATDDAGYFNDTGYGESALRLRRARLEASLRLGPRAALLAEGRLDNGEGAALSALYLRLHPWRERAVDVQAGRIPPVFGAFARRGYGSSNPLVGLPLAYQYLTSLRPNAVPASVDDLLRMRGRGAYASYPIGASGVGRGLPLVAGDRWDTGLEVRVGREPVSVSAAVTQGTLSYPRVRDDNDGKQVSLRVEVRPVLGLVLGASGARGEFLSRRVRAALPPAAPDRGFRQDALGADVEYSRAHWVVRTEGVLASWTLPRLDSPVLDRPLRAWAVFVEGRYRLHPRLFAAFRVDRLGFSRVTGTLEGGRPVAWDLPVSRVEAGAGYTVHRHALLKAMVQHDRRSGTVYGRAHGPETILGAQALVWF